MKVGMTLEYLQLENAFVFGWREVTDVHEPQGKTIKVQLFGVTNPARAKEIGRQYAKNYLLTEFCLNEGLKRKSNRPVQSGRGNDHQSQNRGAESKQVDRLPRGLPVPNISLKKFQ